jgi:hypothetical protein
MHILEPAPRGAHRAEAATASAESTPRRMNRIGSQPGRTARDRIRHWSAAPLRGETGQPRVADALAFARKDLGIDGTDEDRIARYAQRIAENRQRLASIRSALDPTLQLPPDLPAQEPIPGVASVQPHTTQAPARALERHVAGIRCPSLARYVASGRVGPCSECRAGRPAGLARRAVGAATGRADRSRAVGARGRATQGTPGWSLTAAVLRPAAQQALFPRRLRAARPGRRRRDSRRRSLAARRSGGEGLSRPPPWPWVGVPGQSLRATQCPFRLGERQRDRRRGWLMQAFRCHHTLPELLRRLLSRPRPFTGHRAGG